MNHILKTHLKSAGLLASAFVLCTIATTTRAHAVEVIQGDDNSVAAIPNVEVIEGSMFQQMAKPINTDRADRPYSPLGRRLRGSASQQGIQPQQASAPLPPLPQPASSAYRDMTNLIARHNHYLDPNTTVRISSAINAASSRYNLDPHLLASLVAVESSFRWDAISSSGAIGMGQLKPDTAKWLGVDDPYSPEQNLGGTAKYLRFLLDRYNGSVPHALAAYYQGQGTIDKRGIDNDAQYYIGKISRVFAQPF